jgi:hypothetical protein
LTRKEKESKIHVHNYKQMTKERTAYVALDTYLEAAYPFSNQTQTPLTTADLKDEAIDELAAYVLEQIRNGVDEQTAFSQADIIIRANLSKPQRPVLREAVHIMDEIKAIVEAVLK